MPAYFRVEGEISLHSLVEGDVLENVTLSETALNNCHVRLARRPKLRPVLRNVRLNRIHHWACLAHGAYFDEVTVTDIRGGGIQPSFVWGCAFRHVTLRGSIGGLMFRWQADLNDARQTSRYHKDTLRRYESVDWALDTTEARFTFFESLMGIPPHLVRRDPETQFVLERSGARAILEQQERSIWSSVAKDLLESPLTGVVTVVGGRGESLMSDLATARELRDEGLLS